MPMSKKDQAMVDNLHHSLRLAKALRFTPAVHPDVPIPSFDSRNILATGWLPGAEQSDFARVEPACSSTVSHGWGQNDRTTTQNARRLYSTRLLALRALRHTVELYVAGRLAKIDNMIEDEEAKEG